MPRRITMAGLGFVIRWTMASPIVACQNQVSMEPAKSASASVTASRRHVMDIQEDEHQVKQSTAKHCGLRHQFAQTATRLGSQNDRHYYRQLQHTVRLNIGSAVAKHRLTLPWFSLLWLLLSSLWSDHFNSLNSKGLHFRHDFWSQFSNQHQQHLGPSLAGD